nr:hypothetical protein [Pseudoalteromonas sp. SCSIO 43095]
MQILFLLVSTIVTFVAIDILEATFLFTLELMAFTGERTVRLL